MYPDHETYRHLYWRFLDTDKTNHLLDLAGPIKDAVVLDICGGYGWASLEAVKRGAKHVHLVDQCIHMVGKKCWEHDNIDVISTSVENVLYSPKYWLKDLPDVVICQQGVNYWLNEKTAKDLASVIKPHGKFVFNTFADKPSTTPMVKTYGQGDSDWVEVSWSVGDIVHHVQVVTGFQPHVTSFNWLSRDRIKSMLQPYFDVTVEEKGRTLNFVCERIEGLR